MASTQLPFRKAQQWRLNIRPVLFTELTSSSGSKYTCCYFTVRSEYIKQCHYNFLYENSSEVTVRQSTECYSTPAKLHSQEYYVNL